MDIDKNHWVSKQETLSSGVVNDKDKPVHSCRLINTFVIRFLEFVISKLVTSVISFLPSLCS